MALIQITRRCNDCESTRELVRELRRDVEAIRLDYHSLYEKVRTNLAKLAKREKPCPEDAPESTIDPRARVRAEVYRLKMARRQR
jgi:hypothetical protein